MASRPHSEAAYYGVREIDEQGGSEHNNKSREYDIHSLTGAWLRLFAIDFNCSLVKAEDCQNHCRAAQRNQKQSSNITD
jgi:hypothetical protein